MSDSYQESTSDGWGRAWKGYELRPGMVVKPNPFMGSLIARFGSNRFEGESEIASIQPNNIGAHGEEYRVVDSNWWVRSTLLVKGIDYE
jgi:hypothetical protein